MGGVAQTFNVERETLGIEHHTSQQAPYLYCETQNNNKDF